MSTGVRVVHVAERVLGAVGRVLREGDHLFRLPILQQLTQPREHLVDVRCVGVHVPVMHVAVGEEGPASRLTEGGPSVPARLLTRPLAAHNAPRSSERPLQTGEAVSPHLRRPALAISQDGPC